MTKQKKLQMFLFWGLVILVFVLICDAIRRKKNKLDMDEIIDNLYLGSLHAGSNGSELRKQGITRVINLSYVSYPENDGIAYKTINLYDSPLADIGSYFDECVVFIDDALSKNEKILVHCYAGISRSSSIILAYLINKYNYSLKDALKIVKKKRPIVQPNSGFMTQLEAYDASCKTKKSLQ